MVLPWLSQRTLRAPAVRLLSACAAVIVVLGGCGKKAANIQLQSAELEKAFPGLASVAPARTGQLTTGGDPRAFVAAALLASRSNDHVTAVIMLQTKGAALGGVFGQSDSAVYKTRRGVEKTIFNVTIGLSVVFLSWLSSM